MEDVTPVHVADGVQRQLLVELDRLGVLLSHQKLLDTVKHDEEDSTDWVHNR